MAQFHLQLAIRLPDGGAQILQGLAFQADFAVRFLDRAGQGGLCEIVIEGFLQVVGRQFDQFFAGHGLPARQLGTLGQRIIRREHRQDQGQAGSDKKRLFRRFHYFPS